MILKQWLVITNPDDFLREDYRSCLTLFDHDPQVDTWITVGEIDVPVDIDPGSIHALVVKVIDREIEEVLAELTEKLNVLKGRKAQLLALTHETGEVA